MWLFLEKKSSLLQLHTNVGYDNFSGMFDFQGPRLKVKDTVATFRKNVVTALAPTIYWWILI